LATEKNAFAAMLIKMVKTRIPTKFQFDPIRDI
jgi:hypothetical protein